MQKRPKPDNTTLASSARAADDVAVARMVRGLLGYLNRHQGDRGAGVHSLLIAYVQAALQVLHDSPAEHVDTNREVLLVMLDQARRVLDEQPSSAMPPGKWTIH